MIMTSQPGYHSSPSPPSYADAFPVPDYTTDPAQNEQRIEYRHRPRDLSSLPSGIYVQKHADVTVVLNNQEDGVSVPVYGRRVPANGTLLFDDSESITEVTVQIKGRVEFLSIAQGFSTTDITDDPITLFNSTATPDISASSCPNSLSFSCVFPRTVRYGDKDYPIPPSHYILLPGETNIEYARCAYSLVFNIYRIRSRRAAFLGRSRRHLELDIEYRPRSRPPRPIIFDRSLFATIKSCPEEWQQFTYVIFPKPGTNLDPLSCQLFLPSVGIYGIMDTIPFHIQVTGTRSTLSKLVPNQSAVAYSNSHSGSSNTSSEISPRALFETLPIRMTLLRQIVLEINGSRIAKQFPLGDSKLVAIPPPAPPPPTGSRTSRSANGYQENLNWEGEIRVELEEVCPSFNAGMVSVIDFVTLQIVKTNQSLYLPLRYGHPVRLVTDTWSDTADTYA